MAKVQRALPLGKWGVIENVQMNPAGGKYRTTRHPYKMAISNETVIRGSDLADDRIFLSLSNYESIGKTDTKEAVYLIGTMVIYFNFFLLILNQFCGLTTFYKWE